MLIHMVLMEFDDRADAEEFARRLKTLPSRIDLIKDLDVGVSVFDKDARKDGRQWTLGFVMKFNSLEDLEKYKEFPEDDVRGWGMARRTASAACDFLV